MFILVIQEYTTTFNLTAVPRFTLSFSIFRAEYLSFQFLVQLCGTGNQAYAGNP